MQFSKSIPDNVLENPTTARFISVLDKLQEYKQGILSDCIRVNNPVLCLNKRWLAKYLQDYGFGDIPDGMPLRILQQMLLNADLLMRLRGSKLGVEVLCSVCSLGEASVTTEHLYDELDIVYLDSLPYGYVTDNSDSILYLCSNNELVGSASVTIMVRSRYFSGSYEAEELAIKKFLQTVIKNYIGFSDGVTVYWNFQSRDKFHYNGLLNKRFINEVLPDDTDPFVSIE